jgi:hypothetical protein
MKMNKLLLLSFLTLVLLSQTTHAQQSQDFGEYVVHYNALNSNLISPAVAKAYGIQRSSSRALINVTILKKLMDQPGMPVKALVTASGRNLTGQTREIPLREVLETEGAVYYIGELSVRNMETFDFRLNITPQESDLAFEVKFRKQFYTE